MKRKLVYVVLFLFMFFVTACGSNRKKDDEINIVCTQFAQYDWMRNIVGDNGNVNLCFLVKNGVDMHSYQPTAEDMITIKQADMIVYVGGESDSWIKDILEQAGDDIVKVNMMNVLENYKTGNSLLVKEEHDDLEHSKEEHDDSEHSKEEQDDLEHSKEDGQDSETIENDEHIWLSVKNAKILCEAIKNQLCAIDSENEKLYNNNCNDYINKLDNLQNKLSGLSAKQKLKIVLADRHPFVYLFRDCNVECYAAFKGCSAETEASFDTVIELAGKLEEYNMKYVYIADENKRDLADTIISNSNKKDRQILVLESLQSVTEKKMDEGLDYISAMEHNFEELNKSAE